MGKRIVLLAALYCAVTAAAVAGPKHLNPPQSLNPNFTLNASAPDTSCLISLPGDINESGAVTSADIITLNGRIFKNDRHLEPCDANGDVNCSGQLTSADIIYLVNYIFKGTGPAPCDICNDSPMACVP